MLDRRAAILTAGHWMKHLPLFLDTETTGLGVFDQVVEVGVVDSVGGVVLRTLVRPTIKIPPEAWAIHGISDAMVADAPGFCEVVKLLAERVGENPVVIYNAAFDSRLLAQSACAVYGKGEFPEWLMPTKPLCAMELYAAFRGEFNPMRGGYKWHTLGAALAQCNLEPPTLHRAVGDAEACRRLVSHMAAWNMGGAAT